MREKDPRLTPFRRNTPRFLSRQLRHVRVLARRALPTMTAAIRSETATYEQRGVSNALQSYNPGPGEATRYPWKVASRAPVRRVELNGRGGGAPKDRAH